MLQASLNAADGFVLAMLTVMMVSFGIVALLIFCGLRSAARRNPEVDDLIEEVAAEESHQPPAPVTAKDPIPLELWEKEADWWKK